LSRALGRLEYIEDLYSGVSFDPYVVIVLAKLGELDIDRLRERAALLESRTSELVPRLLALEHCFEKVPTPEPVETYQGADLVGRFNAIELKAFGLEQSGVPPHLVGRLTAMELKASGFNQSGQPPQMRIEVLEAFESPLIGDPGPETGRSDVAMGAMVNGSPSCERFSTAAGRRGEQDLLQ